MSSLVKSEVKIETVNDLGNRLDDMKEATEKDLYRLEGATKAFQSMGQAIDALFKIVDQEMDEGKFDLEQAEHIKRFIKRAHQMSINLSMQSENNRIMQLGKLQAMDAALGVAKKMREEEMAKVATLAAALEASKAKAQNGEVVDPDDVGRPVGGRMSIKERRLAEEAAEAAAQTNGHAQSDVGSSTEAPVAEAPAETTETEEPKPAKKPQSKGRWAAKGKRA
jgi:hypothetical protein